MNQMVRLELSQFLIDYPNMSIRPSRSSSFVLLEGTFEFQASSETGPIISDSYDLSIQVPYTFPNELPKITETSIKIPRNGKYHVNPDSTLCLGSPVRVLFIISKYPTLIGFAEKCIVPFLYAVSHKLQYGGDFVFNDLEHGEKGIVADYMELFGVKTREQVIQVLTLLSEKRRIANKKPCPCGCGKRLGKCNFNTKLNPYRAMTSRAWFKKHVSNLGAGM